MAHEKTPEQQRSEATVRRYLEAVSAWDFDVFEEILHADMVWEMPWYIDFSSLKVEGKEKVLAFLRENESQEPEPNLYDIQPEALAGNPERVLVTFRSKMVLNGQPYANEYVGIADTSAGQMLHMREYANPLNSVAAYGGEIIYPESAKKLQLSSDLLS